MAVGARQTARVLADKHLAPRVFICSTQENRELNMTNTKRRNPVNPAPVAKRGSQPEPVQRYHSKTEREMFALGTRAELKEPHEQA